MKNETQLSSSTVNESGQDSLGNRRLRIAYLTVGDPADRKTWSGIPYYMARALEKHCGELIRVGPLDASVTLGKLIHHGVRLATGKNYLYKQTRRLSRKLGDMAERKMSQIQCDVVFAPAGSCVLANLQTRVPIVYFSDATFRLMIDYYSNFSNAFPSHVRVADELERAAIEKAKQLIYPSSWAAESAIRDYGAAESKVNVVPLGANFETPPSREAALHPMVLDQCRLLFVGVDWDQKGGRIAFETLLELERLGIPAELTIVGCEPPATVKHDKLAVFRFLNKNNPQERAKIEQLYRDATFFILPTRAECFGIVSCEANAYGLPVLSTKTGGVPDVVRDGVNGFLFPLEARGDQYALRIRDIFNDAATYNRLRMTSRDEFDTRLNWDTWGERVKDILWAAVAPDSVARPGR